MVLRAGAKKINSKKLWRKQDNVREGSTGTMQHNERTRPGSLKVRQILQRQHFGPRRTNRVPNGLCTYVLEKDKTSAISLIASCDVLLSLYVLLGETLPSEAAQNQSLSFRPNNLILPPNDADHQQAKRPN